jgi:hypothetical protein
VEPRVKVIPGPGIEEPFLTASREGGHHSVLIAGDRV